MAEFVAAAHLDEERATMERMRPRMEGKRYFIVTFGCQMNEHESETMAGLLEAMGMCLAQDRWQADVLLFNTCSIRDHAEKRLFGNIGQLRKHKQMHKSDLLIGVCGCVTQRDDAGAQLLSRFPFVDFVIGTQGIYALASILERALGQRVNAVVSDERIAEDLPISRRYGHFAYVNIMYGCDNFCTYCIVPYVRGRERSRDEADILREVEHLAQKGAKEIMLLGQNVNSYAGGRGFATLLKSLDGVVPRIRFMTSHPKDIGADVIEAMATGRSICHQLHLPVQSGSDAILAAMNRKYDTARYNAILKEARAAMPDIGLSTDIIVGFPGETDADFERTLQLMRENRYDAAFTFAYSPRAGTKAATMAQQVPEQSKDERLQRLISLQDEIRQEVYQGLIGTRHEVLIEGAAKRGEAVAGRVARGIIVNIQGEAQVGEILPVIIKEAKRKTLVAAFEEA